VSAGGEGGRTPTPTQPVAPIQLVQNMRSPSPANQFPVAPTSGGRVGSDHSGSVYEPGGMRDRHADAKSHRLGSTCAYCHSRGEPEKVWKSHGLLNPQKEALVACERLRREGCKLCGAKGDGVHPELFCQNKKSSTDFSHLISNFRRPRPYNSQYQQGGGGYQQGGHRQSYGDGGGGGNRGGGDFHYQSNRGGRGSGRGGGDSGGDGGGRRFPQQYTNTNYAKSRQLAQQQGGGGGGGYRSGTGGGPNRQRQ